LQFLQGEKYFQYVDIKEKIKKNHAVIWIPLLPQVSQTLQIKMFLGGFPEGQNLWKAGINK